MVVMPGLIALQSILAWLATCLRQAAKTVAAEAFVILRSGRGRVGEGGQVGVGEQDGGRWTGRVNGSGARVGRNGRADGSGGRGE